MSNVVFIEETLNCHSFSKRSIFIYRRINSSCIFHQLVFCILMAWKHFFKPFDINSVFDHLSMMVIIVGRSWFCHTGFQIQMKMIQLMHHNELLRKSSLRDLRRIQVYIPFSRIWIFCYISDVRGIFEVADDKFIVYDGLVDINQSKIESRLSIIKQIFPPDIGG